MVSFFNDFLPRSDFAVDLVNNIKQGYTMSKKMKKDIEVTKIEIVEENNTLNKKKGSYYSLRFSSFKDKKEREDIIDVLSFELKKLLKKINLKNDDIVLVVGLGNKQVTADALGPLSSSKVCVTNHLFEFDEELLPKGSSRVCVLSPGVMGQTGLETSDIIKSVNDLVKAKVIIVIDALATYSLSRINKMIQITDTGIEPGSGIGNKRKAINKEAFGVDVIAIGVATVVDTLNVIHQVLNSINVDIDIKKLDFLNNSEYQLVVTPKEIDEEVHLLSDIISSSINKALHDDYSLF